MCQQEEEAKQAEQGTGEHQCYPSAYNMRLRATQSPNSLRKNNGAKSAPPVALFWCQSQSWSCFRLKKVQNRSTLVLENSATSEGEAIFFLNMILKENFFLSVSKVIRHS